LFNGMVDNISDKVFTGFRCCLLPVLVHVHNGKE
jgi:hypothetical protein